MSLLDRSCRNNAVPSYAFFGLFVECIGLNEAPELPATVLAEGCYAYMFYGCTSLKKAPALPAIVMAKGCYACMFSGCTSLIEVPVLPATELADMCYRHMFSGCTSLAESPDLPATKMAEECYSAMFFGCTNLNYVKVLFTDEPSRYTTNNWFFDVDSKGTFVKSKDATWNIRGSSGIPEGWTVITE